MAKRFTDTELWDKEWFMKLNPRLKCLVKAVRDKCDLAGVWSPNWIIMSAYIGEPVNEKELLEIDGGKQFKKIPGGKIICVDFISFQYGTLSEKSPVHRKIISMLKTHKIGYQHPINRVKEKEEDKEEEVEEEKEKDEETVTPEIWPTFDDFWDAYGKKIDRRACEKKWGKLGQETKEKIMQHIEAYVKSTPDVNFRRNPETYLNNESWNNQIVKNSSNGKSTTKKYTPEEIVAEVFRQNPENK